MKAIIIAFFLNIAFILSEPVETGLKFLEGKDDPSIKIKCFWLKDWNIFDLKPLSRSVHQKWDYNMTVTGGKVLYNFCDNTLASCKNRKTLMISEETNSQCDIRAGEAKEANEWKLLNETNPAQGLSIHLNQGETCASNSKVKYTTSFELSCDPKGKAGELKILNANEFKLGSCTNVIKATSKEACPKANLYVIWQFIEQYKWIFGIVLIAIGIFEVFFGVKLVYITIFIVGCLATVTLVFLFMFQFILPSGSNPNIVWVVLGISVVLGLIVGYIMYKFKKIFFGVVGGYLGYIIGSVVYTAFLNKISSNPQVVYWITIVVCIILFAVLAFWLFRHILIFATSICGAYAVIRGISLYTKHFPSESLIMDLIQKGETDQLKSLLNWAVYLYLAGWLVLSIIGIIVQYKITKENEEFKKETEDAFYSRIRNK